MTEEVYYIDKDHIFQDFVSVVFTDNIDESVTGQFKRLGLTLADKFKDGDTGAACVWTINELNKSNKRVYATWMLFDVNKINPGIIVHESVHLCLELLLKRGIKHKPSTDEVYAYTTQWVFNKVSVFYADYLKKNKPQKKVK